MIARYREAQHFPLLHVTSIRNTKGSSFKGISKKDLTALHKSLHYYGVYIIFYTGSHKIYNDLTEYNLQSINQDGKSLKPIYVGKAIAGGSRTGTQETEIAKDTDDTDNKEMTTEASANSFKSEAETVNKSLLGRLREHLRSIMHTNAELGAIHMEEIREMEEFKGNDFSSMMQHFTTELDPADFQVCVIPMPSALVQWAEATLITKLSPAWNSTISGFGNHAPGRGRYVQKRSIWDQLHPGRKWAFKLNNAAPVNQIAIRNRIRADLKKHL
nr:Eco29kI family restriction endonuclease [Deinococcus sp. 6YEL10]